MMWTHKQALPLLILSNLRLLPCIGLSTVFLLGERLTNGVMISFHQFNLRILLLRTMTLPLEKYDAPKIDFAYRAGKHTWEAL